MNDIYTDYLLACQGQITVTGISMFTGSTISHEISNAQAILLFDDSIEEKKYRYKRTYAMAF